MFMTQEQSEKLLGKPYSKDRFWRWVELSHDDVWYYVMLSYTTDAGRASRLYLITSPTDLVNLIHETDEEFWIQRVMAVIPPQMNGTECWSMHQLKELIAVTENNNIIDVSYVYKLDDNLVYKTRETPEESAVTQRQVLFSEQNHATSGDV